MEIILSDDCSSDQTFEIMKEMANAYEGSHTITTRRNSKNLGFVGHIQNVLSAIKQGLVVMAAGDDISDPQRTHEIVTAWAAGNYQAKCIYSDTRSIDITGAEIPNDGKTENISELDILSFCRQPRPVVCSYAISVDLIHGFRPLSDQLINEDFVFPFRSLLLNERVLYIQKTLVNYRKGCGVSFKREVGKVNRDRFHKAFYTYSTMIEQLIADLDEKQPNNTLAKKQLEKHRARAGWLLSLNKGGSCHAIGCTIKWWIKSAAPIWPTFRDFLKARHPRIFIYLKVLRSKENLGRY